MRTPRSVSETVRGFSHCIDRMVQWRERCTLPRGRRPVSGPRPIPAGLPLSELETILRSLPALSASDAESFGADIDAARAELQPAKAGDRSLPV